MTVIGGPLPSIALAESAAGRALNLLLAGNRRYIASQAKHPHQDLTRLQEIHLAQHPFAVVLSCSDSRVAPEILFDQGLGDLFVIRVAGNIVDDAVLGSIEYAVEELGVPLIMVLGHERCGAVAATLQSTGAIGHISTLTQAIQPAVRRSQGRSGDELDNAVRANVELSVEQIKTSLPVLAKQVESGTLKVIGARYDLDEGKVEMIA